MQYCMYLAIAQLVSTVEPLSTVETDSNSNEWNVVMTVSITLVVILIIVIIIGTILIIVLLRKLKNSVR